MQLLTDPELDTAFFDCTVSQDTGSGPCYVCVSSHLTLQVDAAPYLV